MNKIVKRENFYERKLKKGVYALIPINADMDSQINYHKKQIDSLNGMIKGHKETIETLEMVKKFKKEENKKWI